MKILRYLPCLAIAVSMPGHTFQLEFEDTHWSSSFDTTFTYGAQWRLNGQSRELLEDWQKDDSNRNFDKGLVSNSIRFLSEFELSYSADNGDSFGLFTRATGYYDDELSGASTDYAARTGSGSRVFANDGIAGDTFVDPMNSSTTYDGTTKPGDFNDDMVDRNGRGAEFLDFFVFAQLFSDTDHPVSLRLGKQVISWGESAFIQNGISSVMNGADVNKAVQPGMEVKEILRPLGALYGSVQLTDNLTMQAYYQYEWDHIITPAYGSYLNAMPDFLNTDGGEKLLVPMDVLAEFIYLRGNGAADDEQLFSFSHTAVDRLADDDASDDGQWGIAFNWFVPELADTEFGFYMLNYHRKLPDLIVSNKGGTALSTNPITGNPYDNPALSAFGQDNGGFTDECFSYGLAVLGDCAVTAGIADQIDRASYQVKYYEDVKLYGFSWNTVFTPTETAFSGEIALHHNIPVQTTHAFQGLLEDGVIECGLSTALGFGDPDSSPECTNALSTREDVVVMQLFIFHDFNNFTFADDVGLLMEVGWIHAVDLDDGKIANPFVYDDGSGLDGGDDSAAIAGGYFEAGSSPVPNAPAGTSNPNGGNSVTFPFNGMSSQAQGGNTDTVFIGNSPATKDSYGYQMIWSATWYNGLGRHIDALTGTDLIARFAFRHDFRGTSVIPGTGFTEGHKAATVSLEATWQNTWSATLGYTNFFGHSTDGLGQRIGDHPMGDRDFASLAVKYRF